MAILDILGRALGAATAPVVDYLKRRAELKAEDRQQERALKKALVERQIDLISQGLAADATWEELQIRSAGWKDEWVLVLLSIPLFLCFIPYTANDVLVGFSILSQTPSWYQWLVVTIFAAIYGIRVWRRNQSDT